MSKNVSVKDLIAKRESINGRKDKTVELYVESIDGNIKIKRPDRKLCLEAIDMDDSEKADVFMVYNCIVEPNMKDQELQKAYGVVEPDEIITKIFEPGEITSISKQCLILAGYNNSVEVVSDIKNS